MVKISVIICTYNPDRDNFPRTLDGLRKQDLPLKEWELLIIDNNSSFDISGMASLDWHPNARILLESRQGLTNARLYGIQHSKGDLLIFVDDDNILKSDYLSNSLEIGKEHPFLGAWGGKTVGEFVYPPPAWFEKKHFEMLAIRDVERDVWSNQFFNWETTPIGAGLVIRKEVGFAYQKELSESGKNIILDRSGSSLISGGDNEIVYEAIKLGYGTGRFKDLELTHIIPARRLELDYMKDLVRNIAISNVLLYHKFDREYEPFPEVKGTLSRLMSIKWFYSKPKIKRDFIRAEKKGVMEGRQIVRKFSHG